MAGNVAGGLKAAKKNLANDKNFYHRIGAIGGRNGHTGGFASHVVGNDGLTGLQRSRVEGYRGGKISKRKAIR